MSAPTTAALPALDRLPGVGLAELVDRAALQTRVDRKYLLPLTAVDSLLSGLGDRAAALDEGGSRWFGYASLYYDTPELTSYHLAAHGRRRRFKVRERTYTDTADSFLEVKTRGSRGSTVKDRVPVTGGVLDGGFVESTLDAAGLQPVSADRLVPVLHTRYHRATLLLPASNSRVTVDTDLEFALTDGTADDGPSVELLGLVVLETKSAGGPSLADRLLWRAGHRPCRVSKFGTGLAALRPELPANRWHPVLSRHFPPTTRTTRPADRTTS